MNDTVSFAKHEALKADYTSIKADYAALRHELEQLKRLIFGSKRERYVPTDSPDQLMLSLDKGDEPVVVRELTQTVTYKRKKKKHPGRNVFPEHLTRQQIVIEPQGDLSGLKCIGEEITELLCRIPGVTFVLQYVRKKYAQPSGEGILMALG